MIPAWPTLRTKRRDARRAAVRRACLTTLLTASGAALPLGAGVDVAAGSARSSSDSSVSRGAASVYNALRTKRAVSERRASARATSHLKRRLVAVARQSIDDVAEALAQRGAQRVVDVRRVERRAQAEQREQAIAGSILRRALGLVARDERQTIETTIVRQTHESLRLRQARVELSRASNEQQDLIRYMFRAVKKTKKSPRETIVRTDWVMRTASTWRRDMRCAKATL